MEATIYVLLFLISFGISLFGAYNKGSKDGKKELLKVLTEKKHISSETYFKILNIIDNEN